MAGVSDIGIPHVSNKMKIQVSEKSNTGISISATDTTDIACKKSRPVIKIIT